MSQKSSKKLNIGNEKKIQNTTTIYCLIKFSSCKFHISICKSQKLQNILNLGNEKYLDYITTIYCLIKFSSCKLQLGLIIL